MYAILQPLVHYTLHLIVPGFIAWYGYRDRWKKAYVIMLATMLVDLDHLLADPIFDPNRCGIGFHPLHSYYAIAGYFVLLISPRTRIAGIGLVLHMFTDFQDCQWMRVMPH